MGSLRCLAVASTRGRAWWVAPSYKMAAVGWRLIRRMAMQIPGTQKSEVERLITLPTGGTVQVRSADTPDSLRGEGLDYVVVDECAFMQESAWAEALRPALSDRRGGAMFISTPKGRNWFWRLWQQGQADHQEWHSWQLPTASNPYIDPAEIEAARLTLPERIFQQEYLAMFIEDGAGVFRRVMEAATATEQEQAVPGHGYLFGVDWAKHNDHTVICVMDTTTKELVYMDRFNQVDYQVQLGRLNGLYERFRPYALIAEANSIGEPLIEQLQRTGMPVHPFTTTNASKSQAIDALVLAFEQGKIRILNNPVLIGELQAYEMERLPSGLMRYNAPAGMHDDCVMSLALAWQGVQAGALEVY